MLDDTWAEIGGRCESIAHIRWEIEQREAEIQQHAENRRILGSFRDFITVKLGEVKDRKEKERREAERQAAAQREAEEKQLKEVQERERFAAIAAEEQAEKQRREEKVKTIEFLSRRSSRVMRATYNRNKFAQSQLLDSIDLTKDDGVTKSSSATKRRSEPTHKELLEASKRFIPSIRIPRIRVKPYQIPKKLSRRKARSHAESLSNTGVLIKPLSHNEKFVISRSYSTKLVTPTKIQIVPDAKSVPITNEAATRAIESALNLSGNRAIERGLVNEGAPSSRNFRREGARPKDEPVDTPRRSRDNSSSTCSGRHVPRDQVTEGVIGTLADIASELMPKNQGPVDIIADFDREILIKLQLNKIKTDWTKVHVSARCQYSWIGETAAREFLHHGSTEAGRVAPGESRLEDDINHSWSCIRDITHWVRPEIRVGAIVFRWKFFIVPKTNTQIFAPMRVQLGRSFCREFVKNVNTTRRELTLMQDGFREFSGYEFRRAPNVFDFEKRKRERNTETFAHVRR